jgi:hypothetical protein
MKNLFTLPASVLFIVLTIFQVNNLNAQNNPIPPGWEFQATTSSPHGMIIMLEANPRINDIPLNPGDYIGAFYTDDNNELKCAGADFWLGDENIIFAIFGDDNSTPEKDGFSYGEQMYFKVYSYTTLKSYDVDVTAWDPGYYSTDHWGPLGLSAMTDLQCIEEFDAYATANPSPACFGDEVTLSANILIESTGNYTYNWTSQPAGFTSTNAIGIHTPQSTTTYFLEVNDGNLTSTHQITVEVNQNPTANVGADMTICPECNAELSGTAQNYSCVMWQTAGDGTFSAVNIFNPIYYPGNNDVLTGEVQLTMNANTIAPCDVIASDNLTLTIQSVASIGISSEFEACGSDNIILDADAENYGTILWTTDGDGTFSNPDSEITQYFPGQMDEQLGEFTITVCATPLPPAQGENCVDVDVEIFDAPTVNAPATQTKCDNLPIPVTCIPNNYSNVMWTTDGDGTFENPEAISTMYYAGSQDKANGGATVTANVYGSGPCSTVPVVKNTVITLYPSPQVDAGDASVVCSGESLQLNGSVNQYTYFMWTTSGDGYFSNMIIENPVYYPGPNDMSTGNFNLTLTAYPIYPCYTPVVDELIIDIVSDPYVEIITDDNQTYPIGSPVPLEAAGDDYFSLLWETSGDGTFSNPESLAPEYFPGPVTDASGEPVTLSVTAFAAEGCGIDMTDQINMMFTQQATIEAGSDITACDDGVVLNGNSQFCNGVLWETSGDGTFENPTAETTTYIPGNNDIAEGNAEVCLTGFFGSNQSINDCLNITIIGSPNLEAGFGQMTACVGQQVPIELQTAENYSSVFWYSTNGGGDFCNNMGGSVLYTPSPTVDYPQGCITIYALAQPLAPCTLVDEIQFELCFADNPNIEPGFSELNACYNEPVNIELETIENYSSLFWYTTNGGGSYVDLGNGSATYYPAPTVDYPQGCITTYVLAQPIAPCTVVEEINFSICFQPNPEADAGEDQTITELETFIPEPTVSGENAVLWQTSGDGTFSDVNALNPEYFPGSLDIDNGGVQLSITAFPGANCTQSATDDVYVTIHNVQTITIPAGWSGLSSYIDNTVGIVDFFEPISNELTIAQTITCVYWPGGGINTIGNYSCTAGYKIKVEESCDFTITGPVNSDKTINLQDGWNLMPVMSKCYVSQFDLVDALGSDLLLVKEIAGNGIIWPDMNIYTIAALVPGKSYLIALNEATSFTFDECNGMKGGYDTNPTTPDFPWEISERTSISHSIAITAPAMENLEYGDFIGAFTQDGQCVGATEIEDIYENAAITVFGDEPMTSEIEGLVQGETIYFRVFSSRTQTEVDADVEYNQAFNQANGTFAENGISVISNLRLKSTSISENFTQSVSLYPNPSKGNVNLSVEDFSSEYQVVISDMGGHKILEQTFRGNIQLDLSAYPKGFYLVELKGDAYQQIEKLVLD